MATLTYNEFNQPVGQSIDAPTPKSPSKNLYLEGEYTIIESLNTSHINDLYESFKLSDDRYWTYMMYGPFASFKEFELKMNEFINSDDPVFYTIKNKLTGKSIGFFSLMRIDLKNSSIEVGNVTFSSLLRNTIISTESQFLLMKHTFEDLNFRRYEWKCDNFNEPSKAAALRLGFQFEGIFRLHVYYNNRERDTAWFSITFNEFENLKPSFESYLNKDNFINGLQVKKLSEFRS